MSSRLKTKDPQAVKNFGFRWSGFLAGDTISTSTWTITPNDNNLMIDDDVHTTTITTVWLSGGVNRTYYKLTNRITTAGGLTEDKVMRLLVREEI